MKHMAVNQVLFWKGKKSTLLPTQKEFINLYWDSHLDIKRIQVSNILEDDSDIELQRKLHGFAVTLSAFQIMTLKIDLN